MRWIGLLGALWLVGADVLAQGGPRPMPERRGQGGPGGGQGMQRMMPDARPTQFMPDGEMQQRHRMTPEERRQLRRDVHDAGRELYPPRGRERRRDFRRDE